jgi:hypothetical protein
MHYPGVPAEGRDRRALEGPYRRPSRMTPPRSRYRAAPRSRAFRRRVRRKYARLTDPRIAFRGRPRWACPELRNCVRVRIKSSGWPLYAACQRGQQHHRRGSIQMRSTNRESRLFSRLSAQGISEQFVMGGIMIGFIERPGSLWSNVCCSYYLGPFFGIIGNELSEFGRREGKW